VRPRPTGLRPLNDPLDELALVVSAKRELILRAHRFRLRREDLEDCFGQAVLELTVQVRRGERFASRDHLGHVLAQDYVGWGDPGPGRWVTIYATTEPTDHVFIVVAGLRLDTSYNGTDTGPNRFEGGPRWRILDHIPTWAHWSVRHPPGL
jgi:hypothetical protein